MSASTPPAAPVAPGRRFAAALATWGLLALAQPGALRADGFGHTAFVALAPWALVCSRPGRRAFLAEWGAAALGLAGLFAWMAWLWPWAVPPMAAVPALWMALGGVGLRRLAQRFPLALAAPAAWTAAELVRWHLPIPLSYGWWRLGTFAHDNPWLAGSARVWGTWGLGWVFAAFGGWVADLWRWRALALDEAPLHAPRTVHLLGLGPLGLALLLEAVVPPPATVDGPRVLVVQPGLAPELKAGPDRMELFQDLVARTRRGLEEAGGSIDLVCWGETMFPFDLPEAGALEGFRAGARPPAYTDWDLRERHFEQTTEAVRVLVEVLFGRAGRPRLLPPGTAFLTGIETWLARGDQIRTRNAAALWDAAGELVGVAGKVHLAPVAEDGETWARVPFVMDAVRAVGGWVPAFVADPGPGVLVLPFGDRPVRLALTVCYDNAFDDVYAEAAGEGDADVHVLLSNEGWYRRGPLMDHMLAFSRLDAAATGRAMLRVTNSGISALIGPDGGLRASVEDGAGARKMVAGRLEVVLPVPIRDAAGRAPRTPWVATRRWQVGLWFLGLALLIARGARRPRNPGEADG